MQNVSLVALLHHGTLSTNTTHALNVTDKHTLINMASIGNFMKAADWVGVKSTESKPILPSFVQHESSMSY